MMMMLQDLIIAAIGQTSPIQRMSSIWNPSGLKGVMELTCYDTIKRNFASYAYRRGAETKFAFLL